MTIINTYSAENWDAVYTAFSQINFTAYSYDTVRESLIQYLQIYYAETFNDFIESSEVMAIIELFSYSAELLAYRTDMAAHENFITTAQRKQSVLRLAKLISYSAARNIPARGLVKVNTIKTDQTVYDSLGNNLAGQVITWNDRSNANWREQFFLVMNLVLTSSFGQPLKSFQVSDTLLQLYTLNNTTNSFKNGVSPFSAAGTVSSIPMELVPIDIDANGPFERSPDNNAQFNIAYATDGRGDGSDYTGFLMFVKQGSMILTNYTITEPIANRRLVLAQQNVNDTDVWVFRVDDAGSIIENWEPVDSISDSTLSFNNISNRKKYQIDTLENDQIALVFGDGNFSDVPVGNFQLWTRVSSNQDLTIPKNSVVSVPVSLSYLSRSNVLQNCQLTFSLTSALQNNSPSETIEHVRQSAPATWYAQNRMVNGQDYNTFMLRDSTILKLNTINRTFAGQPKYIDWNDASGAYQNIKLFGDDLTMTLATSVDMTETTASSRTIIDTYIQPLLQSNALLNVLTHVNASAPNSYGIITLPRRTFIDDNRQIYVDINGNYVSPYGVHLDGTHLQAGDGSLNEKTAIQTALDGHWYGEPLSTVIINSAVHGVIPDPILVPTSNGKLYVPDLPRTIDGINTYPPGDTGSGLQPVQRQTYFGLKFNNFLSAFGTGTLTLFNPLISGSTGFGLGPCDADGLPNFSYKVETLTIELSSDGTTFTVISNLRGALPNYSLTLAATTANGRWSEQVSSILPVDFAITVPTGAIPFEAGDAFIIDISNTSTTLGQVTWQANVRLFGTHLTPRINLTGWWELIPADVISSPTTAGGQGIFINGAGDGPNAVQQLLFDSTTSGGSWVFLVARTDDSNGNVLSWSIYNRNMKIVASSPTTNFWFNQDSQIIDSQTLKPLYDKIRILRSNIDQFGHPLTSADIYDCVGLVYDLNGNLIPNQLEIIPSDTTSFTTAGDGTPDNLLQFENFVMGSYQYSIINVDPTNSAAPFVVEIVPCANLAVISGYDTMPFDINAYDTASVSVIGYASPFTFNQGNPLSSNIVAGIYQLTRQPYVPAPATYDPLTGTFGCNVTAGLDFMWQHFTPDSNLIDPSVSNIHDAFILTRGYYLNVLSYVQGLTTIVPTPPTPLDLRTSYGYLLENKMLSDTVVLHSGKIKLLFGALADQTLRAKFRVVISPSATFSQERIKQEIINTINTFFNIANWGFGDTFYATELIALIHQALPTQISSVVIVPTYSVNSFGSLFTINSGLDEVLQSAATISDVEVVSALTPAVLRQLV